MNVNLTPDELKDAYSDAEKAARQWQQPFDEYDRIASNKLRADLPPNIPRVNDGSLAALLLETPMRVLPQLPTGKARATAVRNPESGEWMKPQPWLGELATVLWNKRIIPNANTQAPFFTKLLLWLYKADIYGAQPVFDFFTVRGEYRGADFVLPNVRDVFLEPGKVSDGDSDYIFMNTWYTKLQLKSIIQGAKDEEALAKKEQRDSTNEWDIKALQALLDGGAPTGKDAQSQSQAERNKADGGEFYKVVTCFQRGEGAPFYTFATGSDGEADIVRESTNTDPRGEMPITFLYAFEDLSNPYGKGQVELNGGTQNVLDYLTQLDVLATQIGLQPPIKVMGDRSETNLDSLIYAPNAYWFTGQAEVDIVQTATSIYSQFPSRYGLHKSRMQNMQGTTDATISTESGAPGFSKTDAGVKLQQQRTNAHDNFRKQQLNGAFAKLAGSMLNITMSNMQGSEVIELVEEETSQLTKLGLIDQDPNTETPSTQEIELVWDNLRGRFEFDVDTDEDNDGQTDKLFNLIELTSQNPEVVPALQQAGWKLDLGELYARYIGKLGIDNSDKVLSPMSEEDKQKAAQAAASAQGDQPTGKSPSESVNFKDAVAAGATDAAAAMLDQAGLPSDGLKAQAAQAAQPPLADVHQFIQHAQSLGYSPDEIQSYLQQHQAQEQAA